MASGSSSRRRSTRRLGDALARGMSHFPSGVIGAEGSGVVSREFARAQDDEVGSDAFWVVLREPQDDIFLIGPDSESR